MKTSLILQNELFNSLLCELNQLEQNRKFCRHDLSHLIEVARIMLLINKKEKLNLDHDLIIAVALLHDIGRVKQYKYGLDHRTSQLDDIKKILKDCTYKEYEIEEITKAISLHKEGSNSPLSNLLFRADKLSRPCYLCKVKNECYWNDNIKNKRYYK